MVDILIVSQSWPPSENKQQECLILFFRAQRRSIPSRVRETLGIGYLVCGTRFGNWLCFNILFYFYIIKLVIYGASTFVLSNYM